MVFTHVEKCDMLEVYLICRKNANRAIEEYTQLYPDRTVPNRRYFLKLYRKFRTNEQVFTKKRKKKDFIVDEETEITTLAYFEAHPNNSTRDLLKEMAISLGTIHSILKKHKFIPYKYRPVHLLHPGDLERRMQFCRWFINACQENPNHLKYVLWSDESNFSSKGMFNRKNHHYWSQENPFLIHPHNPQNRFSLNVWCGILGSKIVGPYFYYGTLTGVRYVEMMTEILEELLDNLNLIDRPFIYYQQDGAPAHNYHGTSALLDRLFGNQWIGTNGPIQWPARSPDMTPLDFFLWGYVKDEIYKRRYETVDELQININNIIRSIDRRVILKATRSVHKRLIKCDEQGGRVFEHLL